MKLSPLRRPGGWVRAPVQNCRYGLGETVNFTAECACFFVALQKNNEALKQNQSCILAQIFSPCRKLRLEFFRESLFRTATHLLSSTAQVNAARNVQSASKTHLQKS